MKVLYFAWVREMIGKPADHFDPPPDVKTIHDLIDWLAARGEGYEDVFKKPDKLRAAVDQTFVRFDHPLEGAKEVAFFPPVTGG